MPKTITLKINLEGSENVERGIDGISDGLSEMDKIHAKSARESLDRLNGVSLTEIKSKIKSVGDTLQAAGDKITSVGQTLAVAVTAPTVAMATFGIISQAGLEKAEVSFARFIKNTKGFTGSMQDAQSEAKKLQKDLIAFSDTTPFESDEVIASGRALLAAKIPREEIKGYLQDAGDLAAGANAQIEEVTRALTRLKSGDFGESFERLRDFGISKDDLTAKGLEFDKGGSFKGSAEQAMAAVRAIIKERFAGTMDDLSQTLSGRFSTLMDKGKAFFRELFLPAFEYAKPAIDFVVDKLEFLTGYLQTLSPQTKTIIVGIIGGIAALAPFLIILGSVVSFFAPIITGLLSLGASIAAAGGTFAFLSAGIATVGTFITGTLLPALVGLAPVIFTVVAVIGTLTAVSAALYAAWVTDFGGLKTTTLQVFEVVKYAVSTAMSFIYSLVQSVGGQIVGWWRENYPLIKQIVVSVSESIKSTVGAFLDAVREFWENHGAAITDYVKTYWGYVKSITTQVIDQIGKVIRFGLQIINGDWSGAWNTFLKIIQNGAKLWTTATEAGVNLLIKFLYAAIPALVEYGSKFVTTLLIWFGKAVVAGAYIIATLPERIIALVPKLVRAGISIGQAIWQGIKEGLAGGSASVPNAVELSEQNTYGQKTIDYSRPQEVKQVSQTVQQLDTSKLSADADKLKKDREALAKSELSAQISLYANQAEQIKTIYDKTFKEVVERFKESNNPAQFESDFQTLKEWYSTNIEGLVNVWDGLVKQQTLSEKKGNFERELASREHQEKIQSFTQSTFDKQDEASKLLNSNFKKANDEQIKTAEDTAKKIADAKKSVTNTGFDDRIGLGGQIASLSQEIALGRELSSVEQQRIKNSIDLVTAERTWQEAGFATKEIEKLRNDLLSEQAETLKRVTTLEELRNQAAAEKQTIEAYELFKEATSSLDSEIFQLNIELGHGVELSRADEVAKRLQTEAYKNLTPEMKAAIEAKAQEVDQLREAAKAQEEYRRQFEDTSNKIEDLLGILTDSGGSFGQRLGNVFKSIADQFKRMLIKMAADFITSKVFGGSSNGQNSSSGGIGNILQGIFGGGSGTGLNNSNVIRNFAGGSSGASGFGGAPLSSVFTSPGASLSSTLGGEKGGGILGLLQGLIGGGGGAGGGASALAGGSAGLAALLNPVTAALVLAPIGLTTRNPLIGALTLGLTGFIASIFNRNSQRKKDERARTEYINEALASFGDFDKLIADVRALRIDGGSAISQATQLSANIRSNYLAQASQLKDNKTRNIAIKDVSRIDDQINAKMKDLRAAADEARVAGDIDKRLNASFAGGVYMDKAFRNQYGDFKRRNGMLPGVFTGRDYLPSFLADGELVLNDDQRLNVIRNAGGVDPFKGAGIPNYAGGTYVAPSISTQPLTIKTNSNDNNSSAKIEPQFNLHISGVIVLEEEFEAYLESPDGTRKVVERYNKGKSLKL